MIKVTVYEQDSFLILTGFRLKSRYSSPSPNLAQQTKPSAASGRVTEQKSQDSIRQSVMHCVLCTHVHPPPPPTLTHTHSLTYTHARTLARTHACTHTRKRTHTKKGKNKSYKLKPEWMYRRPCILQGTSQVNMSKLKEISCLIFPYQVENLTRHPVEELEIQHRHRCNSFFTIYA